MVLSGHILLLLVGAPRAERPISCLDVGLPSRSMPASARPSSQGAFLWPPIGESLPTSPAGYSLNPSPSVGHTVGWQWTGLTTQLELETSPGNIARIAIGVGAVVVGSALAAPCVAGRESGLPGSCPGDDSPVPIWFVSSTALASTGVLLTGLGLVELWVTRGRD